MIYSQTSLSRGEAPLPGCEATLPSAAPSRLPITVQTPQPTHIWCGYTPLAGWDLLRTVFPSEALAAPFPGPLFSCFHSWQTSSPNWRLSLPSLVWFRADTSSNKSLAPLILFWHLLLRRFKLTHCKWLMIIGRVVRSYRAISHEDLRRTGWVPWKELENDNILTSQHGYYVSK